MLAGDKIAFALRCCGKNLDALTLYRISKFASNEKLSLENFSYETALNYKNADFKKFYQLEIGNVLLGDVLENVDYGDGNREYQKYDQLVNYASNLTWLFCVRLFVKCRTEKIAKIVFIAREGQFLKKMFDAFLLINGVSDLIETKYLFASRRSTFCASLYGVNIAELPGLLTQYSKTSINELMNTLNLTEVQAETIRTELSMETDQYRQRLDNVFVSELYSNLIKNSSFKNAVSERAEEQNKLFNKYFECVVGGSGEQIALVDVGWKGSIQDNIFKITGAKHKLFGYYIGLVETNNSSDQNIKEGLIFDLTYQSAYYQAFNQNRPLLEVLLGADHGSTKHYESGKNGTVSPVLEFDASETELFASAIQPIQSLIANRFFMMLRDKPELRFADEELGMNLAKLAFQVNFKPNKETLNFYTQTTHTENFGIFQVNDHGLKRSFSISKSILAFVSILTNYKQVFHSHIWPQISLYNNGLFYLINPIYSFVYFYIIFRPNSVLGDAFCKQISRLKSFLNFCNVIWLQRALTLERVKYIKRLRKIQRSL